MGQIRFDALDGMRGIAALAVLLYHVCPAQAPWIFPHGYLAVDFFFILSGFVIGYAYEARLAAGLRKRSFLYKRLVRLYPMVLAGAVLGLVGFSKMYKPEILVAVFTAGVLMLPTPYGAPGEDFVAFPINPPSWSLSLEILINAAFCLIAVKLDKKVLYRLTAVFLVLLLCCIAFFGNADFGSRWFDFLAGVFRVCFSFSAGLIIFRLWQEGELVKFRVNYGVLLGALIIVLFVPKLDGWNILFDAVVILFVLPMIVAYGTNVTVVGPWLSLCIVSGELSFPVYILQGSIVYHLREMPAKFGLHGVSALPLLTFLILLYVGFCWIVLKIYDEPLRRVLSRQAF